MNTIPTGARCAITFRSGLAKCPTPWPANID